MKKQDKIKQLIKDYILEIKNPEDKIYDPNIHVNWEEHQFSDEEGILIKWTIFKIIFADGQIIYNFSDENGITTLPNEDIDFKIEIEITLDKDDPIVKELVKNETDSRFSWSSFWAHLLVYGGLALFIIIRFFGPAIISYYKEINNPLRKAMERADKDYVSYNNLIVDKLNTIKTENPFLYVYTNDKEPLSFVILPNMERYEDPYKKHNILMPNLVIQEQQNVILKDFIDNEAEKGYNIWLKTTRKYLLVGNYTQDTTQRYNVDMTYFYTDEEKETVKRIHEKRKKEETYVFNDIFKEPHVDSLQTSSTILSLEQLQTGDYENIMQALFAPHVNPKNKTQKIYFTIYSKNGTKSELENQIQAFTQMFFKGKKCKDCIIRKVIQE